MRSSQFLGLGSFGSIKLTPVPTGTRPLKPLLYQFPKLLTFMGPFSEADGSDGVGALDESIPGVAPGIKNSVVGFKDAV